MRFALSLVLSVFAAHAIADSTPRRCVERIREEGCRVSLGDEIRANLNAEKCRQVKSSTGKTTLELFLLKRSDKVVVVKTEGRDVSKPFCPMVKYTVDNSGIRDMKIIDNKVFMYSNDGQLYVMLADQQVYEILNSSGRSYRGIIDIKGVPRRPNQVALIGRTFETVLNTDSLNHRKLRKLQFVTYTNWFDSLFSDH